MHEEVKLEGPKESIESLIAKSRSLSSKLEIARKMNQMSSFNALMREMKNISKQIFLKNNSDRDLRYEIDLHMQFPDQA